MKIVYIVSTLKRSGPTRQLFNIVNIAQEQCDVSILTLSGEPEDTLIDEFNAINITIDSLKLGRIGSLLQGKRILGNYIKEKKPDIVHTQGIRADSMLASFPNLQSKWIATTRNFPSDDYPTKFGGLRGKLMAVMHFRAFRKCLNLVSCSHAIQTMFAQVEINSVAIQNGVQFKQKDTNDVCSELASLPRPIIISVGSLIPRKNSLELAKVFASRINDIKGSLVLLGTGPQLDEIQSLDCKNVYCFGHVDNVPDFLNSANYFVSASKSEGLPNTVLEALANGLPSLLSDIEPHIEIFRETAGSVKIFSLDGGRDDLTSYLFDICSLFPEGAVDDARHVASEVFSDKVMAQKYIDFYQTIFEKAINQE